MSSENGYWVQYQYPMLQDGTRLPNLHWRNVVNFDELKRQQIAANSELRKGRWFARAENGNYPSDWTSFFAF